MLPFELFVLTIAVIGNGFLALFTLLKNPKSHTSRLFFLFTIVIAIYNIFNYLISHQPNDALTFFWVKMVMSIAVIINLLFYLLVVVFPSPKLKMSPVLWTVGVLSTVFLIFLAQINLIFVGVVRTATNIDSVPGAGIPLFLLHTIIFLGAGFIILIKKLRNAVGREKIQIKLFLTGAIFLFVSILITNVLLVIVFKFTTLIGLLPVYTLIFIGFISYAIVKHRFLNISFILARSVAYVLVVLIATTVYTAALFLVSYYFFQGSVTTLQALVYSIITLLVAFTFQPLKNSLEKVTDAVLFKGHYNSNKLIFDLTTIMALTIDIKGLIQKTLHVLLNTIRVSKGSFIVFTAGGYEAQHEGYEREPNYNIQKLLLLCELKRPVVFDEEPEGEIKQIMQEMNITVALPLYEETKKEGLLLLAEKKSGEIYSQQDIEVLKIFAPEMLVAIQNAKSYEEISKFNVTLKQEVDKATKELRDANSRLQQLDKLKDEFVSVASHELRTPMTAIKSYLWMALDGRGGPISEKQKFYLQRAYNSVDRLIRLVSDMLNVSRIDSGRISLQLGILDLQKTVQEVFDEVMPRIQELGINLIMAQTQALPQVLADSDKVKEVLFNLIGNAMKFTPKGGTITVSFAQKESTIETTVTDTGTGIDPANIDKLFQKFSMIADSYMANSSIQGTGLGLYISKSIVELHGGKIWATSQGHGKGTQFTFSLKVATEQDIQKMTQNPVDQAKPMIDIIHTGV